MTPPVGTHKNGNLPHLPREYLRSCAYENVCARPYLRTWTSRLRFQRILVVNPKPSSTSGVSVAPPAWPDGAAISKIFHESRSVVDSICTKTGASSRNQPSAAAPLPLLSILPNSVLGTLVTRPHHSGRDARVIRRAEFAMVEVLTKAAVAYSKSDKHHGDSQPRSITPSNTVSPPKTPNPERQATKIERQSE